MKTFFLITCLLMLGLIQHAAYAQQPLAQQAFAIFKRHCLDCHGEFGSYSDVLTMKHKDLIEDRVVIPGQPDASELYLRLLGDTDTGSQMPLGQEPLDPEAIATIRRWIEAGAPDWEAIPKPKRRFITTEAMLKSIHTHVTSLTAFDRSFARYFTLTHLYNAGASDDNLRAYRNALSKLVNSLSWGAEVIKPTPIDQEQTIFYIDLRHYEWDIKSNKWYKIEQAYPYGVQLTSSTYTTLCQETNCKLPFIRADWFIATASLPPLYHEILDLPKTDKELETQLEVNVAENLKNAPGVRVWRAGFNESGVSVNNRIVERHKSRYGAYWKSYDFAGNIGTQNIFTHPLNFTHDGGEIIFNLPNGLQAYYLSTATGERLDEAPINIVSNAGARDPVVRNGLSCMGCHTEGMKTFKDQVRSVIEQNRNPSYDKAQALRLYVEKSKMDALVREDIARYRRAIEAAGGVFGGSEPIQQLVKQFEGPLDATHAAAEVGLETTDFLQKIRENSTLQNAGLLVLGVEKGTVKRDAWESQFGTVVSSVNLKPLTFKSEQFQKGEQNGEKELKIAVAGPFTGGGAAFGEMVRRGAELKAQEINAAGGINGMKLTLVFGDDVGTERQARLVATRFATDKHVLAVVGHFNSTCSLAAKPIYQRVGLVAMSPGSTNVTVVEGSDWMFRNIYSDNFQGQFIAKYIQNVLTEFQSIAILFDEDSYGHEVRNGFIKAAMRNNLNIVAEEAYTRDNTDFRPQLARIKLNDPDLVCIFGLYIEAGLIVKQARDTGITAQFFGADGVDSPDFLDIAGAAAEGTYVTVPFTFGAGGEQATQVSEAFETKFGIFPDTWVALTYDAIGMVSEAIQTTYNKSTSLADNRKFIRDYLASLDAPAKGYNGITGLTYFDKNGDCIKPVHIKIVKNGKFMVAPQQMLHIEYQE